MQLRKLAIAATLFLTVPHSASAADGADAREFAYKKTPEGELKLHVHYPPEWKSSDRRPAIVFFFGGGWTGGTVNQFLPQAKYLAERGLVTARADYRVRSRHNTTPDKCVEDAKSAVRWLRQHADELGVDPQRIIASGGSAGGHIAACTATLDAFEPSGEDSKFSCRPNLLVLFNPALDLTTVNRKITNAAGDDIAKAITPVLAVKKDTVPAIIFFGSNDRLIDGGKTWLARAKEVGCVAELHSADGQAHGFFNKPPWTESTLRQADLFLAKHGYLKGEPTIKVPAEALLKRE